MINFKAYSKSFKNKTRPENPRENWVIFKNVHERIIDRETFEQVQNLTAKTKRQASKKNNAQKNMFCHVLYCADCGNKLWFHTNTVNKKIPYFSCSNYKTDTRGTCETRHYVRADAIEQAAMLELRRMAQFLEDDEEAFAELIVPKANQDVRKEKKMIESELQKSIVKNETVARLYEKLYEDNATGKATDEWFR